MFGFNKKKNEKAEAIKVETAVVENTTAENTAKDEKVTVGSAVPVSADGHFRSFHATREYLHQIKDCKHRIKLLGYRKDYRWNANMDTKMIEEKVEAEEAKMVDLRVEISDEISKLNDVRQEGVMLRRYVECLSWEEIALEMGIAARTVQRIHGKALPMMNIILIEDEKIDAEDDEYDADVVAAKVHDYKEHFISADNEFYQPTEEEESHEYFND